MGINNCCLSKKDTPDHDIVAQFTQEELESEFTQIFINNKKWVKRMNKEQPTLFRDLSTVQTPQILYIGCSDSRVPPSKFLSLLPGQVFEHRNIANLVLATDFDSQSVINYAVDHLHVKHIIVCGHYNCGGIAAAFSGKNYDFLNNWLVHLNDVYGLYQKEIDAEIDQNKKLKMFVEFNAIENAINVMKNITVQKHYAEHGFPTVHATVYSIETGRLVDLDVDLKKKMQDFGAIYSHSINAYNEVPREKSLEGMGVGDKLNLI